MISYMLFADNVGSLEVIFDKILLKINRFCWSIDFFCIFANDKNKDNSFLCFFEIGRAHV